jgi:hypothetical protein
MTRIARLDTPGLLHPLWTRVGPRLDAVLDAGRTKATN